jgi:hypothetical protein
MHDAADARDVARDERHALRRGCPRRIARRARVRRAIADAPCVAGRRCDRRRDGRLVATIDPLSGVAR